LAEETSKIENDAVVDVEEPPYPSARYAWYVVGVLMVIYVFSFVDRQVMGLLVGPIKRDLDLSDTQMGLLMGTAFAVFYTLFGIPIGRLADSTSRRGLIAVGLILWSVMTTFCGLAKTFVQFLMARMGVGVGEATLSPSAYSLIADYFPKEKLATAISVYGMGIYIGAGMAYLLGAVIIGFAGGAEMWTIPIVGEIRPWQIVFLIVGIPGIFVSAIMLTVKEPFRRGVKRIRGADGNLKAVSVPLAEVFGYMSANWKTFLTHNVGFAMLSFSSYGSGQWIPEFLIRNHGWERETAGYWYGSMVMIGGVSGIVTGGRIADYLAKRGSRCSKMQAGVIAALVWAPFGILYPIVENQTLLLILIFGAVFTASMPFGAAPAAIQEMMPPRMRAQASAIYLFVVNLIGLGLGPAVVGLVTDKVFGDEMSLRYSLLWVSTLAHIGAAFLLWRGLRSYENSIDYLNKWSDSKA